MGTCCETKAERDMEISGGVGRCNTPVDFIQNTDEIEAEAGDWEHVEEIWREYDTDGSGRLEKGEALTFLRVMLKEFTGKEPSEEELERNFNYMDNDKSGDIDKAEAQKFIKGFQLGNSLKGLLSN